MKTTQALGVTVLIFLAVVIAVMIAVGTNNSPPAPPDRGPDCMMTYNRLEGDVYDSLSWRHQALLTGGRFHCNIQRDILDDLADAPKANRDEDFDRELDAIEALFGTKR